MSNPTTPEAVLSTSDTARAIAAAEKFLSKSFSDYDEPAGGDEYDSWDAVEFGLEDESEIETVEEGKITVACVVSDGSPYNAIYVTVVLDRKFKPIKHDLEDSLNQAAADAAADRYTRRAEDGFRDA